MSNFILQSMEIFSETDINSILKKDMPLLSTAKDFVEVNKLEYYTCCNTWLLVVKDYSSYGYLALADKVRRNGLIPVIREAQSSADELISSLPMSSTLFRSIWNDVQQMRYNPTVPHVEDNMEVGRDALATMLMLLRYPKRLSPLKADLVQKKSIEDFLAVENRCKLLQRRGYSQYFLTKCREVAQDYMPWDKVVAEIKYSLQTYQLSFTNGVGFNSTSSLGSKLRAVSRTLPEAFISPFGIPYSGSFPEEEDEPWAGEYVRAVKVAPVPKSYKASRIIAMEDTARQALANEVAHIIDRYLPKGVPLHDQTVNQRLAYLGSLDGSLATIDLSHASDCITKLLFWEVFPREFTEVIYPLLGTHTIIDGVRRVMQQMSTSGNSLTFILEAMMFNIIELASYETYEMYTGDSLPRSVSINGEEFVIPTAYGDDQVVDSRVTDLHIQFLTALGFMVNESKSYSTGPFRESCGEDYYNGICVSSYYFPRFPLEGSIGNFSSRTRRDSYRDVYIDTLTSLVSLQHRLYGVSYGAAYFIRALIQAAVPKMTTSIQGSLNEDLWDYESTHKTRVLGRYTIESRRIGSLAYCVIQREFKKLDIVAEPYQERSYKFLPGVRYKMSKEPSAKDLRLFELYKYQEFLRFGPKYSDPLCELLGISDRPLSIEQCFGTPEIFWTYREVLPD
jgi:hypothetical protein